MEPLTEGNPLLLTGVCAMTQPAKSSGPPDLASGLWAPGSCYEQAPLSAYLSAARLASAHSVPPAGPRPGAGRSQSDPRPAWHWQGSPRDGTALRPRAALRAQHP